VSEPLLRVTDVDAHYGPIQALRALSLEVHQGERVALVGPNGAGKTSTLRVVSGMIRPTRGLVRFAGEEITGRPAHELVALGIAHVPEGRALFPAMTVEDNLRAGFWVRRSERSGYQRARDRVMDYFPILAEREGQAAGTLSGGEQQMLVVARGLMSEPKLLLIDELSLGLAPKIVAQIFEIIEQINRQGTAVLIVEQFVHMALQNTDRAYALAKGQVVMDDSSSRLLANPQLVAAYLGDVAVAHARDLSLTSA